MFILTCFEDLVAQREARPLVGVVRHESDLEGGSRRDDRRRGDVAAVSTQDIGVFQGAIADLDEVIPEDNDNNNRGVIPNASNAFPRWPEESDHVGRDGFRRDREMKGERPTEDKHR